MSRGKSISLQVKPPAFPAATIGEGMDLDSSAEQGANASDDDPKDEERRILDQMLRNELRALQTSVHRLAAAIESQQKVAVQPSHSVVNPIDAEGVASADGAAPEAILAVMNEKVDPNTTVLIVSRGDERLLNLSHRRAWHFPRHPSGTHSGHHPSTSEAAIAELERLRKAGAQYIAFPSSEVWWLEHYVGFCRHLDSRYKNIWWQPELCILFDLRKPLASQGEAALETVEDARGRVLTAINLAATQVIPRDAGLLVVSRGDQDLVGAVHPCAEHFPQDRSGGYAGYHPANSADIFVQLESLRTKGATHLLIPGTSRWWISYYREFGEYLGSKCAKLWDDEHCTIYSIGQISISPNV